MCVCFFVAQKFVRYKIRVASVWMMAPFGTNDIFKCATICVEFKIRFGSKLKLDFEKKTYLTALNPIPYKSFHTSKQFQNSSKNKLHLKKCSRIDFIIHTLSLPG